MTDKQIKAIQDNIKATFKVENLEASKFCIENNKSFLKGNITSEKAIENIKKHWGVLR
jgi:hypothetical protein